MKDEKNKVEALKWLNGVLRRDRTENLGTPEKKDETIEIENLKNLRNKELITWMNKNKNYVMCILHQFKLMTSSGFGILLILIENIKRDIDNLIRSWWNRRWDLEQRMNWYDNEGSEILNAPP